MSESLRGVDLTRANRKTLEAAKKAFKLACDTSIDSMVAGLNDYLIKLHKKTPGDLLRCDWCGGSSDLTFAACPYCGLTDEESTKKVEEASKKAAPPKDTAAVNTKPVKKRSELAKGSDVTNKATEETAPGVASAPIDEVFAKLETRNSSSLSAEPSAAEPETSLAVVHSAELVTAVDLDRSVEAIKQIQVDIAVNHWLLGCKIAEVREKNLFALRIDETGAPKYKNFGQWVEAELEMTPRYASELAAVSRTFTEAQIKEFGVTKLRVLARIPEEAKRANLLAAAKDELTGKKPTVSQMKQAARPELEKADAKNPSRRGAKLRLSASRKRLLDRDAAANAARMRAEGKITVAVELGLQHIPLMIGASDKPARELSDQPTGAEPTINGLEVRYTLVQEDGFLFLNVDRRRVEEGA